MKKILGVVLLAALFAGRLNAQTIPDTVRYRAQQGFYQQLLKVDAQKARKVAVIQGEYKDRLSKLFGRFELDAAGKAKEMSVLDSTRFSKLSMILDARELELLKSRRLH